MLMQRHCNVFLNSTVHRLLGVLLNAMGAFIVFFTTVFTVLQKDMISAGLAGVSITYAMQVRTLKI